MAKKKQKLNKNKVAEIRKKQAQQVKKIGAKPGAKPAKYSTVFDTKTGVEKVQLPSSTGKARKSTAIRRDVVIYKDGEIINEKVYKALEDAANKGEDRGLKFRQTIRKWKADSKTKGSITARHMVSTMIQDKIARMLLNQNKPLSLIAKEAGTPEQKLLDPSNWDGSVFTNPDTKKKYRFVFRYNYDGSSNWTTV